ILSSMLISLLSCFIGLWISYSVGISSGASIVLFTAFLYLTAQIVKKVITARSNRQIQNQGIS
ncbi:MAG: hypothetical protein GX660_12050, partial [Clostridiaceae bacterium]|nr:hypothetical protein [Clostridiaceae bacterium]